jgi:hypothetical protein
MCGADSHFASISGRPADVINACRWMSNVLSASDIIKHCLSVHASIVVSATLFCLPCAIARSMPSFASMIRRLQLALLLELALQTYSMAEQSSNVCKQLSVSSKRKGYHKTACHASTRPTYTEFVCRQSITKP